jgi:hypothetical protein
MPLIRKEPWIQLSQNVTSEFIKRLINYCAGKMDCLKGQILCIQKSGRHFFITIIPAALTNILNIAPFKNPLDNKVGFGIIVNMLKVYIPKNPFFKCRLSFINHNSKIIKVFFIRDHPRHPCSMFHLESFMKSRNSPK